MAVIRKNHPAVVVSGSIFRWGKGMMKIYQDANHIIPGIGMEWVGHFLRFNKDESFIPY